MRNSKTKQLLVCLIFCIIPASTVVSQNRLIIPFDDGWKFVLSDQQNAYEEDFDDSQWIDLDLPHDWSIE